VQKLISRFGGDPDQVTVLGESAGGSSIEHQITAYGGVGLESKAPFKRGIIQSPAFNPNPTNSFQEDGYHNVLQYASVVTGNNITTLNELRGLTAEQLYLVNSIAVELSPFGTYPFGPSVDGKFVPQLPGELLLHGQFDAGVEVMVGQNAKEGALFASPFITNDTAFIEFVRASLPGSTEAARDYITQTLYPASFDGSFGYTTQLGRTTQMVTDLVFTCNNRYLNLAYNNTYCKYFAPAFICLAG
jgi:carboxylesterase type B